MYYSKPITKMTTEELFKNYTKVYTKATNLGVEINLASFGNDEYIKTDEYKKKFNQICNYFVRLVLLEKQLAKVGEIKRLSELKQKLATGFYGI